MRDTRHIQTAEYTLILAGYEWHQPKRVVTDRREGECEAMTREARVEDGYIYSKWWHT